MPTFTITAFKNDTDYYVAIPHDAQKVVCRITIAPDLDTITNEIEKWSKEAGYNYELVVVPVN